MATDNLGIGVSGLQAAQRALGTASHNIANATTPGYSRQRVEMQPRAPQIFGDGALGTGVVVDGINRIYDEFLTTEIQSTTSQSKFLDNAYHFTSQIDNMLADPDAGLAPALSDFFKAVNGLSNDPASTASRQVLLSASHNLSDRFGYLNNRLDSLRSAANKDMEASIRETNQIASAIADLNKAIVRAAEISQVPANDLLDQRDLLVQKLSAKINVRTTIQKDGRLNVFIGNGQTLVIGDNASRLGIQPNEQDPTTVDVVFIGQGGNTVITSFLEGGELGGAIKFREEVLNPAQNELGRIAIGISQTFNRQHMLGMDLNNQLGANFFREIDKTSPMALPSLSNRGDIEIKVEILDTDKLTISDYQLIFTNDAYELLRLEDNEVVRRFNDFPQEFEQDGFRVSIKSGSTIQSSDTFLILPTRRASELFGVEIKSVEKIAAASPIRAEADIDNLGNAEIEVTQVTDTSNRVFQGKPGQLSPPFIVRFVNDHQFEILDNTGKPVKVSMQAVADDPDIDLNMPPRATPAIPATETGDRAIPAEPPRRGRKDKLEQVSGLKVIEGPITYDQNKGVQVFPTPGGLDRGIKIEINGEPRAGDVFRIEFNTDGVSDNKNALALSQLQTKPSLMNGTSDYAQTYGQLVSRVGSKTHELDINRKAQSLLLDQAIEEREAISGVNLDEEAANMIKFQNLYQANAQVIATTNKTFQILMDAFR